MSTDFSRADLRLLDSPAGMARLLWKRYWRELRLSARAENAQIDYDIMWGDLSKSAPRGIINAGGTRLTR